MTEFRRTTGPILFCGKYVAIDKAKSPPFETPDKPIPTESSIFGWFNMKSNAVSKYSNLTFPLEV